MNKTELLALIKEKEVVLGYNRALKLVKSKKAETVVVSNNCPPEHIESLGNVEQFDGNSRDLGIVFGKPFNVSTVAVVK